MRTVYVDWYAPWSGPLTPARRRILNVWMLCIIPLVVVFSVWWAHFYVGVLTGLHQTIPAAEPVVDAKWAANWGPDSEYGRKMAALNQPHSPADSLRILGLR